MAMNWIELSWEKRLKGERKGAWAKLWDCNKGSLLQDCLLFDCFNLKFKMSDLLWWPSFYLSQKEPFSYKCSINVATPDNGYSTLGNSDFGSLRRASIHFAKKKGLTWGIFTVVFVLQRHSLAKLGVRGAKVSILLFCYSQKKLWSTNVVAIFFCSSR